MKKKMNLLITNKTFEETNKSTNIAASLLDSLGSIIHPEQSVFTPTQTIEYLGFISDSRKVLVFLTKKRSAQVKELCTDVGHLKQPTIRQHRFQIFDWLRALITYIFSIPI